MNKKAAILLLAGLAMLAGILAVLRTGTKPVNGLKVSGTIEATTVELSFKVSGRLAQRLVDEGDAVQAGQLVARLEAEELQEERDARAADLRAAEAGLADLQAGSRQEELAQAAAVLARTRAEAERLARDGERAEALFRREVIPLKDLEAARAARDVSAAAVREAEQRLKLLQAGSRPHAVSQAEARVASSSAALAQAETRLSQSMLFSPLAGLVLVKQAEPGEQLAPGTPVISVAKLDQPWLRAYIPEDQLGRVKVGQTARITVDTWPGRTFVGRVSFISPQAEFTPKNVQTEKERVKLVYRIKIIMDNPNMLLKPGMPADAVIETGGAQH